MNCYLKKLISTKLCASILVLGMVSTAVAAVVAPLESRLGGLAFYDPNLNITWAANANINGPATLEANGDPGLIIGGIGGWRLPRVDVNGDNNIVDCSGGGVAGCTDNEMGFLYWEEGITFFSPGVFSNIQNCCYWAEEHNPFNLGGLIFDFGSGSLGRAGGGDLMNQWFVHSGDVIDIPVSQPGSIALMGLGLVGLLGLGRRQRRR